MTIMRFISAMERYSLEVLLLAFAVCLLTSVIKKILPAEHKKYLTFAPFILGCVMYAAYLLINGRAQEIFLPQTFTKGIECGAAATIYYVMFEQFIRGKNNLYGITDIKQAVVALIIKNIVQEQYIYKVSYLIANEFCPDNDTESKITLCKKALQEKSLQGVNESEIEDCARIIISTLSVM